MRVTTVLLLLIVLGALGISLGRLVVIPKVSDYRIDVEQWASETALDDIAFKEALDELQKDYAGYEKSLTPPLRSPETPQEQLEDEVFRTLGELTAEGKVPEELDNLYPKK